MYDFLKSRVVRVFPFGPGDISIVAVVIGKSHLWRNRMTVADPRNGKIALVQQHLCIPVPPDDVHHALEGYSAYVGNFGRGVVLSAYPCDTALFVSVGNGVSSTGLIPVIRVQFVEPEEPSPRTPSSLQT